MNEQAKVDGKVKLRLSGQELHASPHIEHFPILSYPYISIYGYVLTIYGYVGWHEVLTAVWGQTTAVWDQACKRSSREQQLVT